MVLMQQVLAPSQRNVVPRVTQCDEAWRRLCQLHTEALLTFTLRLTGGDEVRAEAIVHQTLLLAWRNADRLGPIGTLRPWLMSTARRVAGGDEIVVREMLSAMQDAGRTDNRVRVEAALERLAPEQRAALAAVCGDRKTVSAAARSAGVSTGVLKSRVFHALETIRWSVAEHELAH
jgi:RNA polymerase sigma-70 factor (ECF subfamily)